MAWLAWSLMPTSAMPPVGLGGLLDAPRDPLPAKLEELDRSAASHACGRPFEQLVAEVFARAGFNVVADCSQCHTTSWAEALRPAPHRPGRSKPSR